MALKMDHTGAGDITLDSTQAGELRVDGVPVFIPDLTGAADGDLLYRIGGNWEDTGGALAWLTPTTTPTLRLDATGGSGAGSFQFRKNDAQTFNIEFANNVGTVQYTQRFDSSENLVFIGTGGNAMTLQANGKVLLTSSTATRAGFSFPSGSPPTAPVDGDIWHTGGGTRQLYMRMDGVTYSFARLEAANTWTSKQTMPATSTGAASISLPHGTAPTTPVDGDMWTTTAGVFARVNGVTEDLTAGAATLGDLSDVDLTGAANNDLLYRSGGSWIDTAGGLTYNGTDLAVTGAVTLTASAPYVRGQADATAATRRLLEFENWDGVSAYEDVWRMVFNTGTGNAADVQVQLANPSFTTIIRMEADGTAPERLVFTEGFKVEASPALFQGGNASAPGISFASETNTGFFRSAGNNLDISVAGTQVANIDTTNFTILDNLRVSGSIRKDSDTSGLTLYGGDGTGANIELYGGSHATEANNAFYDATVHEFRAQGASPTYLLIQSGNSNFYHDVIFRNQGDTLTFNWDYDTGVGTHHIEIRGDNTTQGAGTNQRFRMGMDADGTAFLNNTWSTGGNANMVFRIGNSTRATVSNTALTLASGIDLVMGTNTVSDNSTNLRLDTSSGYLLFGPQNSTYSHFQTDRARFYFNVGIDVNGNVLPYTTDTYYVGSAGNIFERIYGNNFYVGSANVGYIREVTGSFGSIEAIGAAGSSGTWSGYSIGGETVLMSNLTGVGTTNRVGLYDDINNQWVWQYNESVSDNELSLYFDGAQVFRTHQYGFDITDSTGVTNQPFIGFYDTTTFSNRLAFIQCVSGGDHFIRSQNNSARWLIQGEDAGNNNRNLIIADPDLRVQFYAASQTNWAFGTQVYDNTGNTSGGEIRDHAGNLLDIGFNQLSDFNNNVSDTLEAGHCGAMAFTDNTTAYTLTLAASSDLDFPVDGVTTVVNAGTSGNYTITEGTSTTLYYIEPGSGRVDTAGGCTVGPGGVATIWRQSSTVYYIWGSEITA